MPLEASGLARVLADVLRDQHERLRRGAAGRALVAARFTWPAVASRLAELYTSIRNE